MKVSNFCFNAFLLLFALGSCKKKLETCSYRIQYHNPSIAFVGFSETEVKSFYFSAYKADTNFGELMGTDSLTQSSMEFSGDTAYARIDTMSHAVYGFMTISEGFDYKIQCRQTGKVFLITNIRRGEERYTWTSEHCSPGASQTRFASVSFDVDNVAAYPDNYSRILFLAN